MSTLLKTFTVLLCSLSLWANCAMGQDLRSKTGGNTPLYHIYSHNYHLKGKPQATTHIAPKGFAVLTEGYPFSRTEDSVVIAEKYLNTQAGLNFHTLSPQHRAIFLHRLGIQETDKVFIYNLLLDTLFTYPVKELPLHAYLSLYEQMPPFRESSYIIGFGFEDLPLATMGPVYKNTFTAVGQESPFETGNTVPMIFEPTTPSQFPQPDTAWPYANYLARFAPNGATYLFYHNGFNYYIQQLGAGEQASQNWHLAVTEAATGAIVHHGLIQDTEATYTHPITTVIDIADDAGATAQGGSPRPVYQWTGQMFKGKPPIIWGFMGNSFGCPYISFIGGSEPPIGIRCDNRH